MDSFRRRRKTKGNNTRYITSEYIEKSIKQYRKDGGKITILKKPKRSALQERGVKLEGCQTATDSFLMNNYAI